MKSPERGGHMIRVATLDRQPTVRAGLAAMLRAEPDIVHVGAAADRYELWPLLRLTQPDVLVLENGLGNDGLGLCLRITAAPYAPRVVVFGSHLRGDDVVSATLAGARAILDKWSPPRELLDAIRSVAAGRRVLPAIPPGLQCRAAARLEPGDRAVFAMRLAGTPTADMAAVVGLSGPALNARLAAIVAALGGASDPMPSGPLDLTA